jgi:hypothetical protein
MRRWILLCSVLISAFSLQTAGTGQAPQAFDVTEATIAQIHSAMAAGRLTCSTLVATYLARIDAHDKRGAALNAITQVNDAAVREAA